jgi:D-tyrosyl-tRNA(Tyr) deacylase
VDERIVGSVGAGLLLLIGVSKDDEDRDVVYTMDKCLNLRIFNDEQGKMNRSALETEGEILAVSQFTLYGDTRKGRRPGFDQAAPPDKALFLYEKAVDYLKNSGLTVATGIFGAHMMIDLVNDGPVTFIVESRS